MDLGPMSSFDFVSVEHAEFIEINEVAVVEVNETVDSFEVWMRKSHSESFESSHELGEREAAVKVAFKGSEGKSIIFVFLFDFHVEMSDQVISR